MKTLLKAALFSSAFFYAITTVDAQDIPKQTKDQLDQYEKALQAAIDDERFGNAAGVSGKVAYIYWDYQVFDQAATFFKRSIEYNQKAGNKNGIKAAHYNLGLVNIDQENYEEALTNFSKGIVFAKELGQKNAVLSGLINSASITQSLGKNQQAVQLAEEALQLAQELDNINLVKRCYGILYESYQAIGNSEKSIEYFDLYSTVDKFLKDEQVKQIESASQQKVAAAKNETAVTSRKLESSEQQLQVTQDSLLRARVIAERQRLQLEVNRLTLLEKEAQLENERLIRYGLIAITALTLIFFVILYVQYRQKKKKNKLLEKQNRQIQQQKEEIEKQGSDLSIKNDELLAVNKEKNLMMSMVAHDLKKPINDLSSLSQILEQFEDKLPEDFNHLVSVLRKSSQGYRDMVHKILDAGAIESRKLNVVEERLNIREVFEGNAQSQALAAGDKNIAFDLTGVPREGCILGDKIYLSQAIENVIYNAVKYSPEGSTIFLSAERNGAKFDLKIRDEGPGIPPEELKYLFESFKILKNGDMESTGLGLSISQKYIESMHGTIKVDSTIGEGTTFILSLNACDGQ